MLYFYNNNIKNKNVETYKMGNAKINSYAFY